MTLADLHSEMRPVRAVERLQLETVPPQQGRVRQWSEFSGIEIYTGAGKGKSTSALGRALQAIGRGISKDLSHRVLIMQWLKGGLRLHGRRGDSGLAGNLSPFGGPPALWQGCDCLAGKTTGN